MNLYTPLFLQEVAFSNEKLDKMVSNLIKIVSKKSKVKLTKSPIIQHFKKSSSGVKFGIIVGAGKGMLRFNWTQGKSSEFDSIDYWRKPGHNKPDLTVDELWQYGIGEIIDICVGLLQNKTKIDIIEENINDKIKTKSILYEGEIKTTKNIIKKCNSPSVKKYFTDIDEMVFNDEYPKDSEELDEIYERYENWCNDSDVRAVSQSVFTNGNLKKMGIKIKRQIQVRSAEREEQLMSDYQVHMNKIYQDAGLAIPPASAIFNKILMSTARIANGEMFGLVICGDGGLGKTQGVLDMFNKYNLNENIHWVDCSAGSPASLAGSLWKNWDKICFFDDQDKAFTNDDTFSILKRATETNGRPRMIGYSTTITQKNTSKCKQLMSEQDLDFDAYVMQSDWEFIHEFCEANNIGMLESFEFTGSIVLTTNLYRSSIGDSAFRTRVNLIEVDLSKEQILERIKEAIDLGNIKKPPKVTDTDIKEVFEWLLSHQSAFKKTNFRCFGQLLSFWKMKEWPEWEYWMLDALAGEEIVMTKGKRGHR